VNNHGLVMAVVKLVSEYSLARHRPEARINVETKTTMETMITMYMATGNMRIIILKGEEAADSPASLLLVL
jgi:hypothetical protein